MAQAFIGIKKINVLGGRPFYYHLTRSGQVIARRSHWLAAGGDATANANNEILFDPFAASEPDEAEWLAAAFKWETGAAL